MKHYIKPFFAIVLTVGLLSGFNVLGNNNAPQLEYTAVESLEADGSTFTVYWNPSWNGLPLGWNGGWPSQYTVADCWCRVMGHNGYQQVALYQFSSGSYYSFDSNDNGYSANGSHRKYIKVTCKGEALF